MKTEKKNFVSYYLSPMLRKADNKIYSADYDTDSKGNEFVTVTFTLKNQTPFPSYVFASHPVTVWIFTPYGQLSLISAKKVSSASSLWFASEYSPVFATVELFSVGFAGSTLFSSIGLDVSVWLSSEGLFVSIAFSWGIVLFFVDKEVSVSFFLLVCWLKLRFCLPQYMINVIHNLYHSLQNKFLYIFTKGQITDIFRLFRAKRFRRRNPAEPFMLVFTQLIVIVFMTDLWLRLL